jgi:hypothetical protein
MAIMSRRTDRTAEVLARLGELEHQAELIKLVLTVKHPDTKDAAQAFDGLRKQITAATAERRSHLTQLVAMSVAVSRATSVDDLVPQVREWMEQAGVREVTELPPGTPAYELFEDVDGNGLDGEIETVEPAYVDRETNALLRLGRARKRGIPRGTADQQPNEEVSA